MIEIFKTEQLISDQIIYQSPQTDLNNQQVVEALAGTVLATKDGREFTKLLEVALTVLLEQFELYCIFVENIPQYKSRLRSYRGLLPGLGKKLPEGSFFEKEFDLPDNQSLFAGFLRVDADLFSLFLNELLDTRFAFGLLLEPEADHPVRHPEQFLSSLFAETVEIDKLTHVDLLKNLALFCRPEALLFDISRDGQDRKRFGVYGPPVELAKAMDPLFLRLEERFYLRRRQRGFHETTA